MGLFHQWIARGVLAVHRFRRGMTLGVRAIILDEGKRVFLVKHTYVPGWYLPGGGVEPGETLHEALKKELFEEGNIELGEGARLLGIYQNRRASSRDHVALYHCPKWRQERPPVVPNREILEAGFFCVDDLPTDTTEATKRRLLEFLTKSPPEPYW